MLKLARWSTSHRKYVVLGWLLALLALNALAQSAGTTYSNNFTLPNSDAQRASDLLARSFRTQAGDRDTIVFAVARGSVREAAVRTHMGSVLAAVARLPHVTSVISPYGAAAGRSISANGRIAFATVVFDEKANLLPASAGQRVIEVAQAGARPGLDIQLGGAAIENAHRAGFGLSTAVGLAAAILVLLLTFGSLTAMGLPIVTALFGLGSGLGLIALLTHVVDTPNFSSELAAMIGLGVGIDYALFILTRFREAYATPGPTFENVVESVIRAIDTAGRAVLFAGATVVIALLGMMLLGVDFLYGVAISASIGVLLVMLASLTLLPALLTIAGRRVAGLGRGARRAQSAARARERAGANAAASAQPAGASDVDLELDNAELAAGGHATGGRAWVRWSAFVQRRPMTIAAVSTAALVLVAAPAIALRLGEGDAANDPAGQTTHKAYALLAKGFGQGFNGPLLVVAQVPQPVRKIPQPVRKVPQPVREAAANGVLLVVPPSSSSPTARLLQAVAATPGVAAVTPVRTNATGSVATISVYPSSSPQAYATTQLVARLRQRVIPPIASRTGMKVYVGGFTAGSVDFASTLAQKLPLFIGVVVLLSALLLMVVFRSLVIPLQAAFMNLLSIGASLGVIVAIFQWGWLGSLMGVQKGPIESFIPVMLFAIVFGLSMDYEVFLVSRIHERWAHSGDSRAAVGDGLALTGRVVTAAAAIMVCVFLSFMLGEERVIKEFGLSLASAVLLDAVVVRCLLLPAVLSLLADRTWWLPAPLARLLPRLNIEGNAPPSGEGRSRRPPTGTGAQGAAPRKTIATEGADG